MNGRRRYLSVGSLMLLFCSIPYSWPMFVESLHDSFGWSPEEMGLTFSIGMASFCLGSILGGAMQKRLRRTLVTGNFFLVIGFVLLTDLDSLTKLYWGFGGFLCFGAGILYNAGLSQVVSFYPDKPGVVSGILLMCFGFGSSVIGSLTAVLYQHIPIKMVILVLGLIILPVQAVAVVVLTSFRFLMVSGGFCPVCCWTRLAAGGHLCS